MKDIPYEALCKRLGVLSVGLSPLEMKRALAEKLLKKEASASAPFMLRQLPTIIENELDLILEPLIYKEAPKLFDPPVKKRRPEAPVRLFSQIERTMREYACSVEIAAKRSFPDWRHTYKNSQIQANAFFHVKQRVAEIQQARDVARPEILAELLVRFSGDETAWSLWSLFCKYAHQLQYGYDTGNLALILRAGRRVDSIFSSEHPFALGLTLLYAPVDATWLHLGSLFDKLQHPEQRRELLASLSAEDVGEEELIDAILHLFRIFKFVPPNKQSKRHRTR